ncbi:ATP-dependent CLP protease regulatory subunit [Hyphomicrobium denitrificans 1NES1]|uniref:ATP-dependent CLP protease regulatory subunit n=1 Tax=Hyphomicrobium denitrificans 1NES1 TaxID=670307 RepID=N0BDV2_9HYPH|nr:AAA family ATPase [Hyphomicrobium denitrificans]AGK58681.1 ATP-dependent CLP protease regulatory subunit [Hyphomicrobium denitrificans 1NES1]
MNDTISALEKPRWTRDFLRFLPLKSQFVLSGNVRDRFPRMTPQGEVTILPLVAYLGAELVEAGIVRVIAYDPARGFRLPPIVGRDPKTDQAYFADQGITFDSAGCAPASIERFFELSTKLVTTALEPTAVIADFAARMIVHPERLIDNEHRGFTGALVSGLTVEPKVHPKTRQPYYNPLIEIVEKEGDLPDWLVVNNPRLRHIPLPKPDHVVRRAVISKLSRSLNSSGEADPDAIKKAEQAFVDGTEGLLVVDIANIVQLSRTEGLAVTDAAEAVRRYKLGVTEDVWRKIDRAKLKGAEQYVQARVRGQDHAVQHMLDIVKRAATGIGGRRGGRPRGVAFLAGPTGVGKTELAKTITSLLFGDESAYIRFDMSEFSAEHADQRLIGAPPGYIGYDTGGELTNAIRQKPFSVVLFDEIEKAHPRILDKFLQILDDGVLTSGRGERVYFSESLIIFTSNLGMTRVLPDGTRVANAASDEPLDEVRHKVRSEIERHFKLEISRPEILNRIGENVIVFDFIRPSVAREILELMVDRVIDDVRSEQQLTLSFTTDASSRLEELCLRDLSNGGRGIRNQVEVHLVNPLARTLFALDPQPGTAVTITDVTNERGITTLTLAQ